MSFSSSIEIYNERIHFVLNYIHDHLSEPLTLEQLATIACFSSFHFHRIFTSIVGETPHHFIERLRLERAANKLCTMRNKSMAQIALECGYSSSSSFSRAFKKHHNVSPAGYLKNHIEKFYSPEHSHDLLHVNTSKKLEEVELITLPGYHVAYVQTMNGYTLGVSKGWEELMSYAEAHHLITEEAVLIGIPYDNPRVTPLHKCRYRACITIPKEVTINEKGVRTNYIAAAHYAKYKFQGSKEDLSFAYGSLYGTWLPQSGFIPDEAPSLEIYPPHSNNTTDCTKKQFDILLPIRPL
ncbi:MAG: GyrI-like domain-containing protein [Bacteroidaceae bacterium]|nr:GyrI-like domain-containing protein [Bacteroidaceae bacterium]